MVRSLASRKWMDTSGSNCRSCTRTSESRSKLVFRKRHRFWATGSSPKRVDDAVSPVRIIHQRSARFGNTQLRVGHSAIGVRHRRTRSITELHGTRQPRTGLSHHRNSNCRNRTARNLFRLDAIADALTRGPGKDIIRSFCRKTARLGVRRNPCEGPSDFSRRAAQLLPDESGRIRANFDTYILLRYAPQPRRRSSRQICKRSECFWRATLTMRTAIGRLATNILREFGSRLRSRAASRQTRSTSVCRR